MHLALANNTNPLKTRPGFLKQTHRHRTFQKETKNIPKKTFDSLKILSEIPHNLGSVPFYNHLSPISTHPLFVYPQGQVSPGQVGLVGSLSKRVMGGSNKVSDPAVKSLGSRIGSSWGSVGETATWRIIPVSKWLITMVSKSPN